MATANIGLIEGLQLIVLIATGFGLVWKMAQIEKGLSDRVNAVKSDTDAVRKEQSAQLTVIDLKLDHLNDKVTLSANGLLEKIDHNRRRWEEENNKNQGSIRELQGFLQKHLSFVPRDPKD